MRYSTLVYLTNMCKTLVEAERYLRNAPDSEVYQEILGNGNRMLDQIREVVMRHQEDLKSYAPLEQLKELSVRWANAGSDQELPGLLTEFSCTLVSQMKYQVRAVFFAGLAASWDSAESVYTLMRDDPRFDPVVVLIPTFREVQQVDGQVDQEVIYQDYLTAHNIPFLEYDQYSLDEDCPDLAFTYQVYEGTILPEFWPEYIASRTRLVYLPYYLPDSVYSEDVTALCELRVYDCAWKVIGSTENHYRFYNKHSNCARENMLLTGLPKLDPLVSLAERGVPLPTKWKKLKGKKVFLWNTWYVPDMSSLQYFEDIFEWFTVHQDCALIWRPHPMSEIVMKLYVPEQYLKFQDYISRVKEGKNTILDDESSYEAAFYYSDAQISDYSSMIPQYLLMNKPLLWIKHPALGLVLEELISTQWMEKTSDSAGVIEFLERIRQGKDTNAGLREKIRQRDLPLADGRAGARVCESLWTALHQEDGLGNE